MDSQNAAILGIVALAVSVSSVVIGVVNHKRIRSSCCGKEVVVSVDIETTTPPKIIIPV